MKTNKPNRIFLAILGAGLATTTYAQQVADFENLTVPAAGYWNGSDKSGSFSSGNLLLENYYDDSQGYAYWDGFAYSQTTDTVTGTYANEYSARPGKGAANSATYAVAYGQTGLIKLKQQARPQSVAISNTTLSAIALRDGSQFSKKFGGANGTDPDFFSLTFKAYRNGALTNDSVIVYLADFKASNNAQDFILTTWKTVDLTPLGIADSIYFEMNSSDVSSGWLNNPSYFAMDNYTDNLVTGVEEQALANNISLYPNPASTKVVLTAAKMLNGLTEVNLLDVQGRVVYQHKQEDLRTLELNISTLPAGMYFIQVSNGDKQFTQKLICQ